MELTASLVKENGTQAPTCPGAVHILTTPPCTAVQPAVSFPNPYLLPMSPMLAPNHISSREWDHAVREAACSGLSRGIFRGGSPPACSTAWRVGSALVESLHSGQANPRTSASPSYASGTRRGSQYITQRPGLSRAKHESLRRQEGDAPNTQRGLGSGGSEQAVHAVTGDTIGEKDQGILGALSAEGGLAVRTFFRIGGQVEAVRQYELIISSTRGSVGLKGSLHRMVRWYRSLSLR